MIAEALFVLLAGMPAAPVSCPVPATAALPELIGRWNVIMLGNLDRPRPDSVRAESTISPDLQDCVLQERLRARTGAPPYEAIMFWGRTVPTARSSAPSSTRSMGGSGSTRGAVPASS